MPHPRRTLAGVLFVLALAGCTRPPASEPLLLGYLDTMGTSGRQGVQLAIKEANETDGLVAGRRVALLAPNLGNGEALQAVASRLVSVNRVSALIGGAFAAQAEALGRAAQPANAFVVAPCAAPVGQLGENAFPAQLAPADQGAVLARFVADELKADAVAVLAGPAAHHGELAAAFTRQLAKEGGSRKVGQHKFYEKTAWAELANEVHGTGPKAVLIAGGAADVVRLRAALTEARVKVPLLFGGTLAERLKLETDAEATRGVHVATAYAAIDDAKYRAFAVNYQKEFGEAPDMAARLAYDAGKVLVSALRRSRLLGPDRLREELAKAFVVKLDDGKDSGAWSYKLPGK